MHVDIHTHKKNKIDNVVSIVSLDLTEETIVPAEGYYSLGVHPWNIEAADSKTMEKLQELSSKNNILALGEAGLDRANGPALQEQNKTFITQAKIAESIGKPIILHCVKTYYDILKIKKDEAFSQPWIFHGFIGNMDIASEIISKDCYLSFGENIFTPSKKLLEVIKSIPLQNVFIETDESNIPVQDIYRRFAELREIQPDKLKETVLSNFRKIFGNELV